MADPPAAEDTDAATRGGLTVRDRAVSHVAEYAAREVDGVVRSSSGLGWVVGRRLPKVDSTVNGRRVRVRVTIASAWPCSLAGVSAAVRSEVADRLARYTGLQVDRVDVVVDEVVRVGSGEQRELR